MVDLSKFTSVARATNKASQANLGGFALFTVGVIPGCQHCNGLSLIEVRSEQERLGYLMSEYPWDMDISEDPTEHPDTPHYVCTWVALDPEGNPLDIDVDTLYFAATQLLERTQGPLWTPSLARG